MKKFGIFTSIFVCAMLLSVMAFPGVLAAFSGMEYVEYPPSADLQAHYMFDGKGPSSQDVYDENENSHGVLGTDDTVETVDPAWDSTDKKIGSTSLDFTSTDSDLVTVEDTAFVDIVDTDFSIFCWVKTSTSDRGILSKLSNKGYKMYLDGSGYLVGYIDDGGHTYTASGSTAVSDGDWHHLGFLRTGTTIEVWLDGTKDGYTTSTSSSSLTNNADLLFGTDGSSYFEGNIDVVLIYDAYKDLSAACISQWDMDGGGPSNQVLDDVVGSNDGWLGDDSSTETEDPVRDNFDKMEGSCSMSFTAAQSDRCTVADGGLSGTLDFGSGDDFSIFCWIKTSGNYGILEKMNSAGYKMYLDGSGYVVGYIDVGASTYSVTGTSDVSDGTWHHIGFVRTGSTLEVWVDGFSQGTSAASSGDLSNNENLIIGTDGSTYLQGKLDDVRIFSEAVIPAS